MIPYSFCVMGNPEFSLEVTVSNPQGVHARPSSLIVQLAANFESDITIEHVTEGFSVNAKSVMEIITLAAPKGTLLCVRASGTDAETAVRSIVNLIEAGFEE